MAFTREIIGVEPTWQQEEILRAVAEDRHVSVSSGHGIGKSATVAFLVLWFMSTRPHCRIPVTAPTSHQLFDIVWSELLTWWRKMDEEYRSLFDATSDKFFHKANPESWFVAPRTARPERPEALQGFHAEHLLFLIDEAAGVHDAIFEVAEGALTARSSYVLMTGNPTRTNGYFFDSHHRNAGQWRTFRFSSLDSPLVDRGFSERMERKYGADSNVYRVRVLGEFPTAQQDQLIDRRLLDAAAQRGEVPLDGPTRWGLDVARFGGDETVLAKRRGRLLMSLAGKRSQDLMQTVGWVAHEYQAAPITERPETIFVDEVGLGAGVLDRLSQMGLPAQGVNVGIPARADHLYANLRAELAIKVRDWLPTASIPSDRDLIAQAVSIVYSFDSRGRMKLEKKEDAKKRGLPSPDRFDALMLTFAESGFFGGAVFETA